MDDSAELDLWERARQNDGDAFGRLFDRHRLRVYRRALALVQDRHDAEDVTAAVFFELWRKRHSVAPVNGSVIPWLLVATVNVSRNLRRSTARYRRFLSTAPRTEAVDAPTEESIDARLRLATALKDLSSADSALLVLTVLEGVPIAEAAQAVGLKPATARVRLHRAREKLRTELHDLDPRPLPTEGANR